MSQPPTDSESIPSGELPPSAEIESTLVTVEMIRAYATRMGDMATLVSDGSMAPSTFILSLRRGFTPSVVLPPDSFAMYGGHDLTFHAPLRAGQTYTVQARVIDTYEKSGRSGTMQIIVRQAEVRDDRGGLMAEMIERQVVRRRQPSLPQADVSATAEPPSLPAMVGAARGQPTRLRDLDVGDEFGPDLRRAPVAANVAGYADDNHVYESLFVDQAFARRLGYRDVIVPGPMQTAFLEQFLRQHLPEWRLEGISVTFRMSVITGDTLRISAVVTEMQGSPNGTRMTCDLVIESSDGERATTGHATLICDRR